MDGHVLVNKVWVPRLRLSPSKMIIWDQCQRHLEATVKKTTRDSGNIYSLVGSAAHEVIERINKGEEVDRENVLRETVMRMTVEENIGLEFPKSYKESNKTIQDYEVPYGWHLVSGEEKHVANMGTYDFSYIIDSTWKTDVWIGKEKQAWQRHRIVDYKTSAAKPKTDLQLQLYVWRECARLGIDPAMVDAEFHMLRDNKRIPIRVDQEMVDRIDAYMANSVRLMYLMLAAGAEFPATPGNCYFCQVQDCAERI